MKRNLHETQNETQPELIEAETPGSNVLDFSTTLRELRKNVDPQLVRQRAGRRDRNGNMHMVEYVEWHTVADILDENAPNWGHTVKDIRPIGDIVTVTVAITIDGVTREGIGTGKTASETGIKKAEHDALKRAAVKFGIARELYKKEFDAIDTEDPQGQEVQPAPQRQVTTDAIARSLGDMVTAKQLNMIRAISREKDIDAEAVCGEMFACRIDEISKRAASDLIDRLQQTHANAVPMRRVG
jgi:hypothetical protein